MVSLASAVFYFIRNKNRQDEKQIARALTVRIVLSFFLFLCLFAFYALGWIQPHGLVL